MIALPQAGSADLADIQLTQLSKRFGPTTVVDNLSLSIRAGTTCGFIGLNGAGKTTTLRMLVGLLPASAGAITVAGCEMPSQRDRSRRLIGYVPDRPKVYSWMTGYQAIAFCKSVYGSQWDDELITTVSQSLRLDLSRKVKQLSKGSVAKLSLLLAIGHNPRVLILDEPTSGFDVLARDEFLEGVLAANIAAAGADKPPRTILFSSHSLNDVQRLADTVAILHHGRLVLHEPIDRLLEQTKRIHAVVDESPQKTVAPHGTVRESRIGREWTVTVKDFSNDQVEFMRDKNRLAQLDVQDLTLDQVFRDYVRSEADEPRLAHV